MFSGSQSICRARDPYPGAVPGAVPGANPHHRRLDFEGVVAKRKGDPAPPEALAQDQEPVLYSGEGPRALFHRP